MGGRAWVGVAVLTVLSGTAVPVAAAGSAVPAPPLLRAGQLPGSWVVARGPFTLEAGCLARALWLVPPGRRLRASSITLATPGGDLPRVVENVVRTKDGAASVREIAARIAACRHYSGAGADAGLHGQVERGPAYRGVPGESFTASATRNGISTTESILVMHVGPFVAAVSASDLRENRPLLAQAAGAALADLRNAARRSP